jgi:HEAT repeat protein
MQGERFSPRSGVVPAVVAVAIVLTLGGCNAFPFRRTTAAGFLRTINESKDPNIRYAAYDSLGSPRYYDNDEQKAAAAKTLVDKMIAGKEPVATRAVICRTLGMIGRPEARDAVLVATNDEDGLVRAEACRALGRVGRPEDATVLARIMTVDVSWECRIAAIESLGDLKPRDKRILQYLVTGMEHEDPAIRVACMSTLKTITGKDLGVDALDWKKYVDVLPDTPLPFAAPPPPAAASTLPREAADLSAGPR